MDQEVLSKARGWKCLPQDLRMLGKDPFLGVIMSKFCASSPSTSEIPQEMLPLQWEPHDSAASEKLTEQPCAEREERLGQNWSWSLPIPLHRHKYSMSKGWVWRLQSALPGGLLSEVLSLPGEPAFALLQWCLHPLHSGLCLNVVTFPGGLTVHFHFSLFLGSQLYQILVCWWGCFTEMIDVESNSAGKCSANVKRWCR